MLLGTQRINAAGHLEIGACDTTRLATQFGTPLYVMDEAALRTNFRAYRAAFADRYPRNELYFAGKALLTLAVARIVAEESYGLDVASLGELYVALRAGFPTERLALHGNNKSREELEAAISASIGHIVLDNFQELALLAEITDERQTTIPVMVRVAPGVDPRTHRLIRTGQADTKFGFNITNGAAMEAVRQVLAAPGLVFRGIHCHVGSQLLETETHEEAATLMADLLQNIHAQTGAEVEAINIGGGLGVRYRSTDSAPGYESFAERITSALKTVLDRTGHPYPVLMQEPGRSLVAEAGTTLYTIGAIKTAPTSEPPGRRTYVAIDGGMSDNPRPQLYDSVYECLLANKAGLPADEVVTIAGKHCETDILIWDTPIAAPEPGDLLAVQTTGAYNHSMASNYNRFLRPAMVLVADGQADLIVAREPLEDLVRHERIPPRLSGEASASSDI